jgi:20S proteasome alpha/beta subunit
MTITIGALCDNRQRVILLADKMCVTPAGLIFQVDKSFRLNDHSLALISGNPANSVFLDDVRKSLQPNFDIKTISDYIGNGYALFKAARVTGELLQPQGFVNFADFHNKQDKLNGVTVGSIMEYARTYNLGVELILGGFDNLGGHLYHYPQPAGTPILDDPIGFSCAPFWPNGARAAMVFETLGFSIGLTDSQVLALAFSAKKHAEALGGIGKETDAWLIDKDGIHKISEETICELEKKYKRMKKDLSWVKNITTKIRLEPVPSLLPPPTLAPKS